MTSKNPRNHVISGMFLAVMTVALCQGCAPIDSGTLSTFARDMLLNAAAAFLL